MQRRVASDHMAVYIAHIGRSVSGNRAHCSWSCVESVTPHLDSVPSENRERHTSNLVDGVIYVFGGTKSVRSGGNAMFAFQIEEGEWQQMAPCKVSAFDSQTC